MFSCGSCFHPRKDRGFLSLLLSFLMLAMLSACGGGGGASGGFENRTYPVGGSISGLASGQTVVLENNGTDPLSVQGNGDFVLIHLLRSTAVTTLQLLVSLLGRCVQSQTIQVWALV